MVEILAELRLDLLSHFKSGEARRKAAHSLVDSDFLDIIKREGREVAKQYAVECLLNLGNSESKPEGEV